MLNNLIGKQKDELTLVIEGLEIIIEDGRLLKTMDTIADAFTCVMPWEPGIDARIDEITAPYSYSECGVYLGGELQMEGLLYNVKQIKNRQGIVKELEIWSKLADCIDSSVRFPFEQNNLTLYERCQSQLDYFGYDVVLDVGVNVGSRFSRIKANPTDNCFEHMAKLASQRGLLLSCTKKGEMLIIKPNVDGVSVGTIYEENPVAEQYEAYFQGRNRFFRYETIANSSSSRRSRIKQRAWDYAIPEKRFLTFNSDDSLPGEAKNAAEWRKNKSAADALKIDFPVISWYAPDGNLWQPNTNVTVVSDTISVSGGFTFLITQVEFLYKKDGTPANLKLVPPTMYTTGVIDEPWLSG